MGFVSTGSINEYFLRKALEKGGLTLDDVDATIIAEFPDLNTALGNKAIDAAVQIEPLITAGEDADPPILKYFKDAEEYAPGEQVAVLLYSDAVRQEQGSGQRLHGGPPARACAPTTTPSSRATRTAMRSSTSW